MRKQLLAVGAGLGLFIASLAAREQFAGREPGRELAHLRMQSTVRPTVAGLDRARGPGSTVLRPSEGTDHHLVPHRGLPASLADVPRTRAYAQALGLLQRARATPPGNEEGLLDYHLQFRNRLETCMGTLPQSGSVTFRLTFRPATNEQGEVTAFGAPADVFLEDASGLGEPDVEHLERCGGTAGYGLPMEHMSVLPRAPEAVVFLTVRFPVDRDSFPYKLLREGQDEITHP